MICRVSVHVFVDESRRGSTYLLAAALLVETGLRGHIYHGRGLDEAVRGVCLSRLVANALEEGCTRLVLDSRGQDGDRADRRTIVRVLQRHDAVDKMTYEHLRSHEDPALWIPDVLAWCHGAGGDWWRRIAPVVRATIDVGTVDRNGRVPR